MKKQSRWLELGVVLVVIAGLAVYLSTPQEAPSASTSEATASSKQVMSTPAPQAYTFVAPSLQPLAGTEAPPQLATIEAYRIQTDGGDVIIQVYPEAAPNAAERFRQLVEIGFYDNTPVSRVVPDFVAQFGINPHMAEWKEKAFDDDPSLFQHSPGTLAFAKAGPNTNSTQVFINYVENNRLADPSLNFTVFGEVTQGMEVVKSFKNVGEQGLGLNQQVLWTDTEGAYLDSLTEKPTMIQTVTRLTLE